MNKKKKQIPVIQGNEYPFGGLINQGVTSIAKTLGANDKTAQVIGSGVATATGLIPGMQANLMQGIDFVGDASKLMMANGGDPTKVKYTRHADQTTGEFEITSNEDLAYLKKYNEVVKAIQDKHPEIFGTTKASSYNPINTIKQTAGIKSGDAKADYVVSKALTELKDDSELQKFSPYLYDAGLTTLKDQKDLLDNIYRITGTDIISNDYRPGLRHLVTFDYEEPTTTTTTTTEDPNNTNKVYTPKSKIADRGIESDNPAGAYDVITKTTRDKYGRPVVTKVSVPKTQERKNFQDVRGIENQEVNTNYYGEHTQTEGGKINREVDLDKKAMGGKLKYIYALGGEPPQLNLIPNEGTSILQPRSTPIIPDTPTWNLKHYQEYPATQVSSDAAGNVQTVVLPRSNRLKAHGKNILNMISGEDRATVAKTFALGGTLTEYEGPTHEEGGIPFGNSNIEVEGDETKFGNYIFSNRLKLPWNPNKSFGDESTRIANKYKDRPDDQYAKKAMEFEMAKLTDAQEFVKQQAAASSARQIPNGAMISDNKAAYGGKIYYWDGGDHSLSLMDNPDNFSTIQPLNNTTVMGGYKNPQILYGNGEDFALMPPPNTYEDLKLKNSADDIPSTPPQWQDPEVTIDPKAFPEQEPVYDASWNTKAAAEKYNPSMFNDELTTAEKLVPFLPVAAQAATLIGGPEKTRYDRAEANLIDLEEQRRQSKKQAAIARLTAGQNIRNTAGNTGRGLTNTVTANAAIYDSLSNQLGQSYMNEENTNAGILNQTNQFNTQITNAETDANAANRARFRDTAVMTLANLANTYTGINKDQRAYRSQNLYNTTAAGAIGAEDYGAVIGYTKDGMPILDMKFKK